MHLKEETEMAQCMKISNIMENEKNIKMKLL